MPRLFIMCGLPFSGKTTISKEISNHLKIPRISFDEVWQNEESQNRLDPKLDSIGQWKYIKHICELKITEYLDNGMSVIYDNLGDTIENRRFFKKLTLKHKSEVIIVYLEVSKEEVLRRRESNMKTNVRHQVSDANFKQALQNFEPPTLKEEIIKYENNEDLKKWLKGEFIKFIN